MTLSKSHPRASQRWTLVAVAVVALSTLLAGLALANHGGATSIPANYAPFTVQDQQGANDVPGQVDLTQMGRDDSDSNTYRIFWSWDSHTAWTGTGQTGDACALFDTDSDTFVNFVVCIRVENFQADPNNVRILLNGSQPAYAFSCSDKKNDRCTNPAPVSYGASQIQAGALGGSPLSQTANLITHTDPFPAGESYNNDTSVEVHILKSLFAGTEVLVNVCSYPSAGNGGNNNPFDCIVSPGGGFLRVVKSAVGTAPTFTFSAARGSTSLGTFTVNGAGTATLDPQPSSVTLLPILVDPQSGANLTVTETAIPSPWDLTAVSCKVPPGGSNTGSADLANDRITAVSIQSGQVTECTFTDALRTGTLRVIKVVVNDDGGQADEDDWTYNANESPDQGSLGNVQTAAGPGGQTHSLTAGTTFNVVENAGGPAGYTVSYGGCEGTIQAGTTSTCTITNSDNPPSLTLTKTVVNDNGQTNVARDFTLSATGSSRSFSAAAGTSETSLTGSTGAQTVTAEVVYTLSENTVAGYTASGWTCSGTGTTQGTGANANTVTIALGGSGTCAITNSDNPPSLTLTKTVVNDNGQTNVARDFTLSATGSSRSFSAAAGTSETSLTGSTGAQTVTAEVVYTLSENTVAGYTASGWTCSGTGTTQGTGANANTVTIALGGSGTCAITNFDSKATPEGETVQSWTLHDSITIDDIRGDAPGDAASVTFRLYNAAGCAATAQVGTDRVDPTIVAGAAATPTGITVTESGTYYWTATYSGDQYNEGFTTVCGDEITQILAKDAFGGGRNDFVE